MRGFEWESLLLVGKSAVPQVIAMKWWSREKGGSFQQRQQHQSLLSQAALRSLRKVRHVFDRGYGTGPWLWRLWMSQVRFVVRLSRKATNSSMPRGRSAKPGRLRVANGLGEKPDCCGTRTSASIAAPACSLCRFATLSMTASCGWWWCDKARGANRGICSPMNPSRRQSKPGRWPVPNVRRWKIEESFRFQKTELQIESLRLQDWESRRKMLLLVTLAYRFLLSLLVCSLSLARSHLLAQWCQRADWRLWTAKVPLYRLRWALSRLWQTHPPRVSSCRPFHPLTHVTWPACSLPWWITLWHQCGRLC